MNLNISTQFINNCLGNNVTKGNETNSDGFTNLLATLNALSEGLDLGLGLDKKLDSDKEDIDYNLLSNILNNLQIMDNSNAVNMYSGEVLNTSVLNNENIDLEKLNEIILNQGTVVDELNKEENKILKLINETLQNQDVKNNKNIDLNLIKDVNTELGSVSKKEIQPNNDLSNQYDLETKEQKSYKELETNILVNRNNVIKSNSLEPKDKDLSTLESILDGNDSNSFINLNTANSNVSPVSNKGEVVQENVKSARQEFIGEDIVETVKYLKTNGLEEIKIKITPRELGDMTIKLVKDMEETKVHIIISKDDTFNLVNKNIGDISKHLKDLNINVKEISVDIESNNEKFFSDNLNQEFNRKNQENKRNRTRLRQVEIENIDEIKEDKILNDNLNILI